MKNVFFLIGLVTLITFYGCKPEVEVIPEITDPEALSEAEVEILDNLPDATDFNTSSVVLPNGITLQDYLREVDPDFYNQWSRSDPYENLGPQDARNLLIARLTGIALNLTDRSKYQKVEEGTNKPKQDGLAYSWGGKDHTRRQAPPGAGTQCTDQIYGLDCSGFIYQLFSNAGVDFIIGPANSQRKPEVLQKAIQESIPVLEKVKVEDLGAIPTTSFESGDIIYWLNSNSRATHIGIVLKKSDGKLAVFQSNGSVGRSSDDCSKNLGPTRGPRTLALTNPYWFGPNKRYGITRINADISGKWDLFLRCNGQSTDAITFQLDFPTSSVNTFKITGDGLDYDGHPFECSGDLTYDNTTNTLSGTLFMTKESEPNFYRYDSFSVKLNRDETDYFSFVLGDNQEGGCTLEGKLKNNE